MNKPHVRQSGFTLIELMIAISILSLLLFTGSYSYSMLAERWNKELGQFSSTFQEAKNLELLQRLIEGVHPLVLTKKNNNREKELAFLFVGGKDSLLAVSHAGLFYENTSEIFRLSTLQQENGLYELTYQSVSTNDNLVTSAEQSIAFTRKVTLFANLESVDIQYYGYQDYNQKMSLGTSQVIPSWYGVYSAIDKMLMPETIRVRLNKNGQSISFYSYLPRRSERWYSYYREDNDE